MAPLFPRNGIALLLLACMTLLGASCGKRKPSQTHRPAVFAPELAVNHSKELPGVIHSSRENSAIHWQPWSRETFRRAEKADRLVLAVICLPHQWGFNEVLQRLENHPGFVSAVNGNYVPVLVDADAVREMGLLTAPLCSEIKQPLDLPLFLWMTHEANPVAWMPLPQARDAELPRMFNQSHEMVSRMWRDDPDYVLSNSRMDNASRSQRLREEKSRLTPSANPSGDALNAARQMISLYDPYSRTIDESGGLLPAGVLDVVIVASSLPGVPAPLRERSVRMMEDLLEDLLPSAMFDPLEGGVFAGRGAESWTLPNFSWNCPDQGRIAALLFRAHQLSGDRLALDRALALIRFAEERFLNEEQLFVFGKIRSGDPSHWLWTTEEIEKALPAEDAKWWIAATGMKSIGNLPSEIDPERRHFRMNSLSLPLPLDVTASKLGVPAGEFQDRFEKSRRKLAEIRRGKLGGGGRDALPHLGSNLRMISAYAAAFTATGEEIWRGKAEDLLGRTRKTFAGGGSLRAFPGSGDPEENDARAFLHALAIQSALDVNDISPASGAIDWVAELAGWAEALFLSPEGLMEAAAADRLVDLPISDLHRIFDDTSGGLFSLAEARLARSGLPVAEVLGRLSAPLPEAASRMPILHTDLILSNLIRHHASVVVAGEGLPADFRNELARLPLLVVPRVGGKVSDGIPQESVRVIAPDGSGELISNPSDLKHRVLLPGKNP